MYIYVIVSLKMERSALFSSIIYLHRHFFCSVSFVLLKWRN